MSSPVAVRWSAAHVAAAAWATTSSTASAAGPFEAFHRSAPEAPSTSQPCTHPASETARRVRALTSWARQDWARWARSVHVYDEAGTPHVHVVLVPQGSLDEALAALLDSTGLLQYRYPREYDDIVNGSVLLDDGTVVNAAVTTH